MELEMALDVVVCWRPVVGRTVPLLVSLLLAQPLAFEARARSAVSLGDYIHTVWTQHDGMPLGDVGTIRQTSDGYLWVLTREQGLLRFDGMRFTAPATPCTQPVKTLVSAPDG